MTLPEDMEIAKSHQAYSVFDVAFAFVAALAAIGLLRILADRSIVPPTRAKL